MAVTLELAFPTKTLVWLDFICIILYYSTAVLVLTLECYCPPNGQ